MVNNVWFAHIWSKVKNTFICIYLYSGFMDGDVHKFTQFTNCLEMAVFFLLLLRYILSVCYAFKELKD